MTTVVRLKSPRQLGKAFKALAKDMDRATINAFRATARYGATQALRVSAGSRPRPRARGTYERSFKAIKLPDGAAMVNTSKHAIFVEVGRRKGRMPPVTAIEEWIRAKGIGRRGRRKRYRKGQLRSMAYVVARKIAKHGTKGRFVIKRTVPIMVKRLPIEVDMAMQKAFDKQTVSRG